MNLKINETNYLKNYFSLVNVLFILIKSNDGFGLLILPYLFQKIGILLSFLSYLIVILLFIYSTKLLAEISLKTKFNGDKFHDIIIHILGNKIGFLFFIILLFLEFLYSFCYIIFSFRFLNYIFCNLNYFCNDNKLLIIYFIFLFIILLIRKKLKNIFTVISIFSSLSIIIFIILFILQKFSKIKINDFDIYRNEDLDDFKNRFNNFFLYIGVLIFTFKNIGILINNQRTNSKENIGYKTYLIFIFFIGFFNFIFSYITSIIYKSEIEEIIFFNIEFKKNKFLFFLEMIYGFGIIFSTPINDLSFFNILKKSYYIKYWFLKNKFNKNEIFIIKGIFRLLVIMIFFILMIDPRKEFMPLITFVGSLYGLVFVLIIPIFLYIYIIKKNKINIKLQYIILIIGIIILAISFVCSIINLMSNN